MFLKGKEWIKRSGETNISKKGHVDYKSGYHKKWGCCNLTNCGFLNGQPFRVTKWKCQVKVKHGKV